MAESRLQRWSRKKAQAGSEHEPAAAPAVEPEPSPEERELAVNEALPELQVLEKYNLPNPDAIELGTDITGFMRKEIPEFLRRRALRSLWRSNPVLAVLDGLNDYDEDYTTVAGAGKAMQTLYKVGQGFDRTGAFAYKPDEPVDDQTAAVAESAPETGSESTVAESPAENTTETVAQTTTGQLEPDSEDEPLTAREVQSVDTETAPEPAFHYRPRMRFDT